MAQQAAKEERSITLPEVTINVIVHGSGDQLVVMHPCLGRGASDFDGISRVLAGAGYMAVSINPRGIERSTGLEGGFTGQQLAGDMAGVIQALGFQQAHVVGNAFGYRVAANVEVNHPKLVQTLSFLAHGGQVNVSSEVLAALDRCYQLELPDESRMKDISTAFFAPSTDPTIWRGGWYPEAAEAQRGSLGADNLENWRQQSSRPLLIVQGMNDALAPPQNGYMTKERLGDRVTVVDLPDCGHGLVAEQPELIGQALIGHFKAH